MARSFNGTSDWAQVELADIGATQTLTIAFWLLWDSFANNDKLAMEWSENYNNNNAWIINPNASSTSAFGVAIHGSGYNSASFTRPSAGVWHHYGIRLDITKTSEEVDAVYVDGVAQSLTYSANDNNTVNFSGIEDLNIMCRDAGANLEGAGDIAEIAIWDVLLSEAEIQALAEGAPATTFRRSGALRVYLPMWGIASPEVDLSGRGLNATVSGAVRANHAPVGRSTFLVSEGETVAAGSSAVTGTLAVTQADQTSTASGTLGSGWFNTNWAHRREVTVDNTAGAAKTDYAVKIELTSANFDFTEAQSNGEDVRVTDSDGTTLIDHWIESWDDVAETAVVWAEVPSIPGTASRSIYLYYGNLGAADASSIKTTFAFGDAFDTYLSTEVFPLTVQGPAGMVRGGSTLYMSVWNDDDSSDLYKSDDGGDSWTLVSEITAAGTGDRRGHLATDGNTDLWAFTFGTNGIRVKRSTDLGVNWGSPVLVDTKSDFTDLAGLWVSGTSLFCFYIANDLVYRKSTDNGATWGSETVIAADPTPDSWEDVRAIVAGNGDLLVHVEQEVTEKVESNAYQFRSTDGGANWGSKETIHEVAGDADVENGDYALLSDGTLAFVFPSDEAGGQSYYENKLYKKTSTDHGVTWSAATLVDTAQDHVNVQLIEDDSDNLVVATLRRVDEGINTVASVMRLGTGSEQLDDNWTQDNIIAIPFDGLIRIHGPSENATDDRGYMSAAVTPTDYAIHARARGNGDALNIRLYLRYGDINNQYAYIHNGGNSFLFRREAGTFTELQQVADAPSNTAWHLWEFRIVGDALTAARDGTELNSATDATFTTGNSGIGCFTGNAGRQEFDWVFVRPYDGDDPTQTVGSQEDFGATFPDAPPNVTAVAQSDTEILVSYDAVSGADAYDVERDGVVVANKITDLSFLDTGLTASTQYSYRVRAARNP